MGLPEEYTFPKNTQGERPILRANPRQREVLFKRVGPLPEPNPGPPPPAISLKTKQYAALGKAITARTMHVRHILSKRFPKCFRDFGEPKVPLKVGIVVDAILACPDIKPHAVALAVNDYCRGASYHRAMIEGATRIDLDGNPVGVVTKGDADRAAHILKKVLKDCADCALLDHRERETPQPGEARLQAAQRSEGIAL